MAIHRSSRANVRDGIDLRGTDAGPVARRHIGRRAAALLALAMPLALAAESAAREPRGKGPPITLAEVASRVQSARLGDVVPLLRHDVETELAALDWGKTKLHRPYTLSAAVVKLESVNAGERTLRSSCTVSAAIRDDRGTLLAIIEGRAGAEGSASMAAQAEREALAGAVKSAITALPESIRRAQ